MAEGGCARSVASSARLVVVWRVTTRCNLGCGFCAYDRALRFERHDATWETASALGRALAELRRASGREVHVSFLGGEPTLWPLLAPVARDFRALGLSLGITSNGTTLQRSELLDLLCESFDEVTLSVDGLSSTHERLRGWPGGFAALTAGLGRLRARRSAGKPRLRVNTVLMRDTVEEFASLCRTLADLGVDELSFNRLGERDRPEFFAGHRASAERLARLNGEIAELRRELSPRGLRILGSAPYVEQLVALERGERQSVVGCGPGRDFLFVDERGLVAPCSFTLDDYAEPVSRELDLAALPALFSEQQLSRRSRSCDDCRSTQVFGKFRGT